ncbi:MAG TPA: hypothetical protein VEY11_15335 [Pyrinomonadaceae bacterium]|nr:hypothetical protein [Pyrinomonadaceae bacterium]
MKALKFICLATALLIPQATYSQRRASSIRSVDFANFTFPAKPIYSDGKKSFRLKDGTYQGRPGIVGAPAPFGLPYPVSLVGTGYGELTHDDKEEAMVVLAESVAGTAIPFYVYIYSMRGDRPEFLWAFAAGDRGDGGLRKVYAENGELVVELYGKNTGIGDIGDKEEAGACCPKSFTRTRYRRRGGRFRQKGCREVLPNPLPNAELLMS